MIIQNGENSAMKKNSFARSPIGAIPCSVVCTTFPT